jgi:mannose-6-phosphate isomerase-like protein (cupin superfamily)
MRSPKGTGRKARLMFDERIVPGAYCSMAIMRHTRRGGTGPALAHDREAELFSSLGGKGEIVFMGQSHELTCGVTVYMRPQADHFTRKTREEDLEFVCVFCPTADLGLMRAWERAQGPSEGAGEERRSVRRPGGPNREWFGGGEAMAGEDQRG